MTMQHGWMLWLAGALATSACGPSASHAPCRAEEWAGACRLTGVHKLREAEFPVPHMTLAAVYTPERNQQYPAFTPPEQAQEIKLLSMHEVALRDHLDRHTVVRCHLQPPPQGSCTPGTLALGLPVFDPETAPVASGPPPASGCAQLESEAAQDRIRQLGPARTTIPEEFQFERESAAPPADAGEIASRLAQRIRSSPGLECVAIVGHVAPGESPGLADQRARAVKNLLLQSGVDPARLMTISANVSVYGAGSAPPPDDPDKRRVRMRVLLESGR
jgi:outer membrane protein OmpA-like peptidoglycan-associated protein